MPSLKDQLVGIRVHGEQQTGNPTHGGLVPTHGGLAPLHGYAQRNTVLNGDGSTAPGAEWTNSGAIFGGANDGSISAVGGAVRLINGIANAAFSQAMTGFIVGRTYRVLGDKQVNRLIGVGDSNASSGGLLNLYNSNTLDVAATSVSRTFIATAPTLYFTIGAFGSPSDFDNLEIRLEA